MARQISGFFTDDPEDYLILTAALDELSKARRRASLPMPDKAIAMQRLVARLFGPATGVTRGTQPQHNPQRAASSETGSLMTVKTAAELIGVSPSMVRRDCAAGGPLEAVRVDGRWRITPASAMRRAEERKTRCS